MQDEILQSVYANPGFIRPAAEIRLRQQFLEKVQHYYRQSARIQRQNWSEQHVNDPIATDFDLAQFRALASQQIGHDNWLALDYYLTDDALYGAVVTPDDHFVFTNSISGVILRSLHRFPSAPAEQIATDLFAQLGMWLLPDAVQSLLDPETHLLIAPHKQLHQLPWAALPVSAEQKLLVNSCIPSIVPSLSTLYSLWLRFRDNAEPEEHSEALLLALSEFNGRYPPLPEVDVEAEAIGSMPGLNVKKLQQEQATWGALRDLSNGHGLSQFSFWHIATHAFHDAIAGRLSGIAVYDRDIWIDYLWQCAPLPHLVTLSACSGNRSKLYAGDEQVGLASTCLAAGAQTIIGSLRPIQDLNAARLMVDFYNYYIGGNSAAQALVLAQRSALAQGTATDWAFFTCIGAPTTKIK